MIKPDTLQNFFNLQQPIWSSVSSAFSEASEQEVTFSAGEPTLSSGTASTDVLNQEALFVQFCYSALTDHSQLIVLNKDFLAGLLGQELRSIDDSIIPDVRHMVESIVQGICIASGEQRSETVSASDLQIRFQVPTYSVNLQDEHTLLPLTIAGTEWAGSGYWITDKETIDYLLNEDGETSEAEVIQFPQLNESETDIKKEDPNGLDRLLDIPLEISVELGRIKMLVKDVVELGSGSIVEIEKAAGEPVDILVNGRLVAKGEVVVIEDNFGVRITEILSKQDRLNKLNEVA